MPYSNRADLTVAIASLLMRPADAQLTTAVLNDMVALAEADMFRRLGDMADCETHDDAFAISAEFTTLPTGFKGFRRAPRLVGATSYRLTLASPTQIDAECDPNSTGEPRLYCIEGNELRLGPIPSSARTLDMTYFGRASAITDSVSNFLLDENPDLYLYGSACHAAPFIGEDSRLGMWKGFYEQAITTIRSQDRRKKWSGGAQEVRVTGATP